MRVWQWVPAFNNQVHAGVRRQAVRDGIAFYKAALMADDGKEWELGTLDGHSCDLNYLRNNIVDRAIKADVDYLFMQDADVFAADTSSPLMQMIDTCQRTESAAVFAMVLMRTEVVRANTWPCKPGEVFELEKAGTGMLVIDINRLRKWYADFDGPLFLRVYTDKKGHTQKIGQDVWFCHVLRKQGERIFCDGRIPTVHVNGTHELSYNPTELTDNSIGATAATEQQT
jgi:hypothetical protein